jgi:hypothetical protein
MESILNKIADRLIFEYEQITASKYDDYYEIDRKGFKVVITPADDRLFEEFEIKITTDYPHMVKELNENIEYLSKIFVTDCFGDVVIDEALL